MKLGPSPKGFTSDGHRTVDPATTLPYYRLAMRQVESRAGAGEPGARLALDVYVHRLRAHVAAMVASLGGLDVLAFTGGVGERSPEIRARTGAGLAFLGVAVDATRNKGVDGDGEISSARAAARTVVIRAREDLEIASQVRSLLKSATHRQKPARRH